MFVTAGSGLATLDRIRRRTPLSLSIKCPPHSRLARSGTSLLLLHPTCSLPHKQRPFCTEVLLSLVGVVRPTTKLQILHRRLPSFGVGQDVMKLQKAGLGAPTVIADKCASAAITSPHVTFDGRGNMSRHG